MPGRCRLKNLYTTPVSRTIIGGCRQPTAPPCRSDGALGQVSLLMRESRATLNEGVVVVRADPQRSQPGIRDTEALDGAIQAHEILNCPDAWLGVLIQVRRQFRELLCEARGLSSQPTELDC
jgi:hypothetical protein